MPELIKIPESTQTDEELDEEILEIFVEEVDEVLEEIVKNFKEWSQNPENSESLKTLRRAFHTLKGSGRLVGAMAVGELGWQFEELFNNLLNNTFSQNDKILKLVTQIESILPSMVEDFKAQRPISHKAHVIISQAHYLTKSKGQDLVEFEGEEESEQLLSEPLSDSALDELLTSNEDFLNIDADDDLLNQELSSEDLADQELLDDLSDQELADESLSDSELPDELSDNDLLSQELPAGENFEFGEDEILDEQQEIDPSLLEIFKNETNEHLLDLRNILENYENDTSIPLDDQLERLFHTLNGSSLSVDFAKISNIAGPMENYARVLANSKIKLTPSILVIVKEAIDLIDKLVNSNEYNQDRTEILLNDIEKSLDSLSIVAREGHSAPESVEKSRSAPIKAEEPIIPPEAADEFTEIFLDEAEEILENTQSLLERWQSSPDNMELMKELQRELHTLKGGARMVGIVQMGDLSHKLESVLTQVVEGNATSSMQLQEIIQSSVDELAAMLETVKGGAPLSSPADLIEQIDAVLYPEKAAKKVDKKPPVKVQHSKVKKTKLPIKQEFTKPEREGEMVDASEDRIRVRVSLIDKLTHLAQSLSVSRAHMEQKQGAFKNNLDEMEQTIIRLRDQLRRLDIETEAQILSHYHDVEGDSEEFDPLELDRFSLLQQLSRSLMESVSDLMNIQDYLKIVARQSETLLSQESRTGAELQENIMRTRMIPFSRIAPRLQRITRLTAKELRKQVEFVINGENIEFERTVLNRIVAPLEHMLRNALDHGIETTEVRQQMGKPAVAKITIDISKEGTDINIKFSDDGAGLHLAAIRKKAEERGIIKPNEVVDDHSLSQFILEPAFSTAQITSTAKKVTQTSGRGVGMDVVASEIKQLGGNLQIFSKTGKGTVFEIHLPLSLTVNKALMVYVGDETLSVPLNNIVAVMRIPRQDVIFDGKKTRYFKYIDNRNYRIFHLGEILGFGRVSLDSPLIPTLLIRSAGRCVALLVDGIEGQREIVVKPVGPQIGAIPWIGGATVLGDGRVVLILDVVSLTRIENTPTYEQQQVVSTKEEKKPAAPLIMVVDDSITVRKVTARLLKRQGMEVLTAKDGVDAVAQLQENIPNLMLLDIEMPRMDGYELAIQVRNTPNLKHIPIIMITSRSGAKHRSRAEKIGVNRYLGKPFNEKELLQTINALLKESAEGIRHQGV